MPFGDDMRPCRRYARVRFRLRQARTHRGSTLEAGIREVDLSARSGDGEAREGDVNLAGGEDLGAGGGVDGDVLGGDA